MSSGGSHSHSFSNDERKRLRAKISQKDIDNIDSYMINRPSITNSDRKDMVRRLYGSDYDYEIQSKGKGKHGVSRNPSKYVQDTNSVIDDIKKGKGKFRHSTKSKRAKAKKLDQDLSKPKTIKDLENSGKLNRGSGIPMGLIMGMIMVGVMLVIALPIFDTITTDMQNQNLNATSGVDSKLSGFPSFVQDNLIIVAFVVPLLLFTLIIIRFIV